MSESASPLDNLDFPELVESLLSFDNSPETNQDGDFVLLQTSVGRAMLYSLDHPNQTPLHNAS